MAKGRVSLFVCAAGCALAACDQTPVEAKRSDAMLECLHNSWLIQGYAVRDTGGELRFTPKGEKAAREDGAERGEYLSPPSFRFTAAGDFVVDYGQVSDGSFPPFSLVCTGDFNRGVFDTVQINGVVHRPGTNEVWPIDRFQDQVAAD